MHYVYSTVAFVVIVNHRFLCCVSKASHAETSDQACGVEAWTTTSDGRARPRCSISHLQVDFEVAPDPFAVTETVRGNRKKPGQSSASIGTGAIPFSSFVDAMSHESIVVHRSSSAAGSGQASSPFTIAARRLMADGLLQTLGDFAQNHTASVLSNLIDIAVDVVKRIGEDEFNPFKEMRPEARTLTHQKLNAGHENTSISARPSDGGNEFAFFQSAPFNDWLMLAASCTVFVFVDSLVFQRMPNTFKWHLLAMFFWVAVAAGFNLWVWTHMGQSKALYWCAGYVLEWMLSMDNLFVFQLIFNTYQTPSNQIHKAVFVGFIGAALMRLIFFMVVSTFLRVFHWIRYPFGALLIWSGIETVKGDDDDVDVKDTFLVRCLTQCLGSRLLPRYEDQGSSMFIQGDCGKTQVTLLFVVVACLECTDLIFALDSVGAKVAQIPQQYIAFSSSVLAMFGLRAMFFIIRDLLDTFALLKYGLCIILVFIGTELILADYIALSASTVCVILLAVFMACIAGSVIKKHVSVGGASGIDAN